MRREDPFENPRLSIEGIANSGPAVYKKDQSEVKKLDFRGALGPPWGGGGFKARVQGRHCPPARQRGKNYVFG